MLGLNGHGYILEVAQAQCQSNQVEVVNDVEGRVAQPPLLLRQSALREVLVHLIRQHQEKSLRLLIKQRAELRNRRSFCDGAEIVRYLIRHRQNSAR